MPKKNPATLELTGSSSDPVLIPEDGISLGGAGAHRTVGLQPAPDQAGRATITLTVSDGYSTRATAFTVKVHPQEGTVLAESFDYPDGPLGSSGVWVHHSGATNELEVADGRIQLLSTGTEDLHAELTGAGVPYLGGGWILYATLHVTVTTLPDEEDGGYFAYFNDPLTGGQVRGRLLVLTNDAAEGAFRFAVANGSARSSVVLPQDCEPNVAYRLVVGYDVDAAQTTLWINPTSQLDSRVTATDVVAAEPIRSFSFHQQTGIGTLNVDDLEIGTAFPAIVSAFALHLELMGPGAARLRWPVAATASGYVLQSSAALTGGWVEHPDQGSTEGFDRVVELNDPSGSAFFRLFRTPVGR